MTGTCEADAALCNEKDRKYGVKWISINRDIILSLLRRIVRYGLLCDCAKVVPDESWDEGSNPLSSARQ